MTGNHASARLIEAYAGGADVPGDQAWALEAHLESCAHCRGRLADVSAPAVNLLVEGVWAGLGPSLAGQAPRGRRLGRWLTTWVTPAMLPWLVMIVLMSLLSFWLDSVITHGISLVQLLAPVLPVLGVAASWARGLDPGYEIVTATPRAGLYLVLRRTTAVLVVVLPVLLVAGWLTGAGIGLWLLPSLAFTSGTLALGGVIGVTRAAYALIAVWLAVFVFPVISLSRQTFALSSAMLPVWAGIFAVTVAIVAFRRNAFARLGAHN